MTRVRVIVEGQTEETFVKETLAPALFRFEVFLTPTLIGRPGHRGGRVTFERLLRDLTLSLKEDPDCWCTSLIDFYGRGSGFPDVSNLPNSALQATALEEALSEAVSENIQNTLVSARCRPYIQVHEFEALLFSDPERLSQALYKPHLGPSLGAIRAIYPNPEDINESRETAPSKRLMHLMPSYDKVLHGSLAATHIGVERMLQHCPRFAAWFNSLSSL